MSSEVVLKSLKLVTFLYLNIEFSVDIGLHGSKLYYRPRTIQQSL